MIARREYISQENSALHPQTPLSLLLVTSQGSREQSDLKTQAEAGIIIVTLTCSEIVPNRSRKINSLQVR